MKTNNALSKHARCLTTAWAATKLLPLLLLLILPGVVEAQFNYTTTNGTITITGYTGYNSVVTIPSRINDLPVTAIGYGAFCESGLTSVTIPTSVTSIGVEAFCGCSFLTSVTIPNSVTSIGVEAFEDCPSLTAITVHAANSVYSSMGGVLFDKSQTTLIQFPGRIAGSYTIPDSVTSIGDYAFQSCSDLGNVIIPNSVTNMGEGEFAGCRSLTNVTIGNSVTSIGYAAFCDCSSLTSVTIPNSVTSLGNWAFDACTNLTSVTIPDSVTSIGEVAFGDCTSLTAIMVNTRNPVYSDVDGVLFNHSLTMLVQCPGGIVGSYTIPNTVTNIGDGAFSGCSGLTKVTIPSSVTSIGDWAFSGCARLTSVCFQGNAPSFGQDVFDFCYNPDDKGCGQQIWDPVTIYYLPGTTGWSTNLSVAWNDGDGDTGFLNLPTALWLPQVQTSDGSVGVRTNQFGFTINWSSGMTAAVDACTNLANPTWIPLATNTLTSGSLYFSDSQWKKYPSRFYRLRMP